ncbi:hypothetical protein BO70DRAFT_343404 [Aspergillus heteromorphus CBS 117.55]|uniref:Involucrin repeat protein n=1 Tax=Aspergillus heteromorphus CBS 117.55 TaxID=1448321 RepID=A0A317VBT8_9EURO|nr:uncharacterized protein BO70DRAFT_343404 [Aspergillus heteromorphus CBS 117.55]PWY70422.1 hypothetical protein BO70DRAFT_343404 [Aspergillus heteromorphus CBS 117.55]
MFKGLFGGNRSSSDVRSTSSSKSGSRRKTDSKSSTVSRKSSRGDDRDRGLGDLSTYRSSSSRSKRYAPSAAGESVASSYATADQGPPIESERIVIERAPRRRDSEETDRRDRYRDNGDGEEKPYRRRDRVRSPSRERERTRTEREERRRRTQSGDMYASPITTGTPTTSMPSSPNVHAFYDPHVPQQFPGQFPTYVAEPYRPPHPAGEAAEYYGDQGQSVQDQPGVRPKPPLVIPEDQAHLMTASPVANPPPEPSSMGQVGAAAAYFTEDADLGIEQPEQSTITPASKPPKLSKPTRPPKPSVQTGMSRPPMVTATAATTDLAEHSFSESPSTYVPPSSSSPPKPSHSHAMGTTVGAAAAGAAAGYMMGHHHQSSASVHSSQYTMQNYEQASQNSPSYPGPSMYPPQQGPEFFTAGPGAPGYAASPLHPEHAALYHATPLQSGGLAFQRRQKGPLDKFIDFWKDPEGVGEFEDYTETIGICKYCFDPGSTSRDAPRRHNHARRRRSADRYSSSSRVDKTNRYPSSEDEGRRRKSSPRNSWIPGFIGGYAVKSMFSSKDFDETYSVRSGRVAGSRNSVHESEGASSSGRRSQTSRGVHRRSYRSRSRERTDQSSYHSDSKTTKYDESRRRSRSRSRSSSITQRHAALRDAALGAAVGTATLSAYESHHQTSSRSSVSRRSKSRKTSSSDESVLDISRPARKAQSSGLSSFFTASSENRRKRQTKKRRSLFSFNNSSSSSLDADLAFGSGYAKRKSDKSKRRNRKEKEDVDMALLGLGAAATALAASSHRRSRRAGEVLARKDSRLGQSDYASSATNDEGWEDLDSGDQSSSSVNSGLAFGSSGRFPSSGSQSSDSGTSKWTWGWGSKKSKKEKKKRRSRSSESRFPAEAAVVAGLGTAALASAYNRDSKTDAASSTGSLQQVAPVPTSDPSRFDTVNVSSFPPPQPTLVRPGPIPLQQPQPVTPVSQAVYTTQGESIHAYSAPDVPPSSGSSFMPYETQLYSSRNDSDVSSRINRPHRRSDSSPVFHTEPLETMSTSTVKRRSTIKDQASVQFDLTEEQADKERRASRRERSRRDDERQDAVQLIDREHEMAVRDAERQASRQREQDYEISRAEEDNSRKERDSSSRIGSVAIGAISGVTAITMLSGQSSHDDASETASQRRHEERREKRRAERRRVPESDSISSSLPMSEVSQEVVEERPHSGRDTENAKPSSSPSRRSPRRKPVYEDYAQFFAPEELRYSPDTYARREPTSMPTIIEAEPSNEFSPVTEEPHPDYAGGLPWPVPELRLTEPTPPQSVIGARETSSPRILVPGRPKEDGKPERQTTGSRVSWGEHEMHEYEVPSTSSELESIDQDIRGFQSDSQLERIVAEDIQERPTSFAPEPPSTSVPSMVGADIEFAATVAAAAAAAGFDPSLVTDNPTYHTRASPPTPETKVKFVSPWEEVAYSRPAPHGFVEGEVETPDESKSEQVAPEQLIEDRPFYSEPEPLVSREPSAQRQQSIAQEVIGHLSRRRETEGNGSVKEDSTVGSNKRDRRSVGRHEESEPEPLQEVLSMPGGFETEDSPDKSRGINDPSTTPREIPVSIVSAAATGERAAPTTEEKLEQDSDDYQERDDASSVAVEGDSAEGKKKRRKRRSKRDSDNVEDSVSTTSSSARTRDSSGKRRSTDDKAKETRSGGFLSNLFGSRVSEPIEKQRSSSADRRSSREVQSEIGSRRKEKSSRRRSSSRGDTLDNESRVRDERSALADKENINIEDYKSSRHRRKESRRQGYEDIVESGKSREFEKV